MTMNRLKTMRKVKGLTQAEVAKVVNITQNTYSYWESGKVKIDNESFSKLAEFYGVALDFLIGRTYKITTPVEEWRNDLKDGYMRGDSFLREYYEYLYGNIVYTDGRSGYVNIQNSVIGDNNFDCCNGYNKDRLEKMLLTTFNKLTEDEQFDVIAFAKKILEEK